MESEDIIDDELKNISIHCRRNKKITIIDTRGYANESINYVFKANLKNGNYKINTINPKFIKKVKYILDLFGYSLNSTKISNSKQE